MHKTLLPLFLIALCLFSSRVAAQSACSSLLQQGVYDQYSMNSASSSYSGFVSSFCSNYYTYNQAKSGSATDSSDSVSIGGDYDGIGLDFGFGFGQGSSLSAGQVNALAKLVCSFGSNTEAGDDVANQAASFVDPSAMQAYEDCLSQYAAGLQVTTNVRQIDQAQVTIEVKYVAPTGAPPQTELSGIEISPLGSWVCDGPLMGLLSNQSDHLIGTDAVAMSCTRNVSGEPFVYQNQSLYAGASTITIMLTSGTVTRSFIPIYVNPPGVMTTQQTEALLENKIALIFANIKNALTNGSSLESTLYNSLQSLNVALSFFSAEYEQDIIIFCSVGDYSEEVPYCNQTTDYSGPISSFLGNISNFQQVLSTNMAIINYALQDYASESSDATDNAY